MVAIDLTLAESDSDLASSCAESFQSLWSLVGMDNRSKVSISSPSPVIETAKVSAPDEEVAVMSMENNAASNGKEEKRQRKKKAAPKRTKKREVRDDGDRSQSESSVKKGRSKRLENEEKEAVPVVNNFIAEEDALRAKFKLAEMEVEMIRRMIADKDREVAEVGWNLSQLSAPNVESASALEGASLLLDLPRLARYLNVEDEKKDIQSQLERWGVLSRWWRLIDRCLAFYSIFACLRSRKKKKGSKIQERYHSEAKRVGNSKVYSFAQASRFERIGKFLLKFPRFVYQTQFVSQADWFHATGKDGRPLVDVVEELLGATELSFWKDDNSILLDDQHDVDVMKDVDEMSSCDNMFLGDMNFDLQPNVVLEQSCGSCNDKDQLWLFCNHVLSSMT